MSNRDNSNSNFWQNLGKGILIGAGALAAGAAVAATAYAASQASREQEREGATGGYRADGGATCKEYDDSDEDRNETRRRGRIDVSRPSGSAGPPGSAGPSGVRRTPLVMTQGSSNESDHLSLKEKLEEYYYNYTKIRSGEMVWAEGVTKKARLIILDYFRSRDTGIVIESIEEVGSAFEGLKVITADEFDFALNFMFREPVDLSTVGLKERRSPGYWLICDTTPDAFRSQQKSKLFTDLPAYGSVLSPQRVREIFQSQLQRAFNEHPEFKLQARGPSWNITYKPGTDQSIDMDFVPTIQVAGKYLVSKPHPDYVRQGDTDVQYVWRESFSKSEKEMFRGLSDATCQKASLQIIKAIRLNYHAEFGRLSSYFYKTIVMNMMDNGDFIEEEWMWDSIAERYLDFLLTLSKCLHNGEIRHHYISDLNLLEGYNTERLRSFANFLDGKLRKQRGVEEFLKKKVVTRTAGQKLMEEAS